MNSEFEVYIPNTYNCNIMWKAYEKAILAKIINIAIYIPKE